MAVILAAEQITKHFGGSTALDAVSLDLRTGEIHGLIGENGSGKSTFIKVLAGFHTPDSGSIRINGELVPLPVKLAASDECSIAFVHQDLGLIPELTVLENFHLKYFAHSKDRFFIDYAKLRRELDEAWTRFGIVGADGPQLNPDTRVSELAPLECALLAIVRAVSEFKASSGTGNGVLVLDEPTVYLPTVDRDELFTLVKQTVAGNQAVLFVSHDLEDVLAFCDRITIFRDGKVVRTVAAGETSRQELVQLMTGHDQTIATKDEADAASTDAAQIDSIATAAPVLSTEKLSGNGVRELSFTLARGEILGFVGIAGSGFIQAIDLLFGAAPARSGSIAVGGVTQDSRKWTPTRAIAAGFALVPEDRVRRGGVPMLTVGENVSIPVLSRHFSGGRIRERELDTALGRLLRKFDVRPANTQKEFGLLSGGNQQKAIFAKWLNTAPAVLLLQEPTQGVDVGARESIWADIATVARTGVSIVIASSDHDEIAALCDRAIVFREGRGVAQITGPTITKYDIASACHGQSLSDNPIMKGR